jgi:hypothetical protein
MTMRTSSLILRSCGAAALLLAASAVSRAEPAPTAPAPAAAAAKKARAAKSAAPAAPANPDADPVQQKRRAQAVYTYNGGQITVGDLEDALARQSAFMRTRYRDEANLKEFADKALRNELMADEAQRQGYGKSDAVTQAVKQNAVQTMMKVEFDDKLSQSAVTKDEIEAYYKAHIDEYVQPQLQRASHVMVSTEAEANQVYAEAKDMDLRAFRQLARDKSIDDVTKMRGGDLRYFDAEGKIRGAEPDAAPIPPAIAKAAFALKNSGDLAPKPIKIEGGYSILKLTGSRPAVTRKVDEVADTIRVRLWRDKRQQAIDAFVAKLQEQVKPEIHADLLGAIKIEDAPTPGAMPSGPGPDQSP